VSKSNKNLDTKGVYMLESKYNKSKSLVAIISFGVIVASCQTQSSFEDKLSKTLKEKPELIINVIEENPSLFMTAIQNAAKSAQADLAKKRQLDEANKLEAAFNKPLKPMIRKDETFRGDANAPITLVEYSDFECPFCSRGFATVKDLLAKYKGQIRFVYKHLPLSFHPQAMISAQYYEALRLQSGSLAIKFHDAIFDNQGKLKNGEKFLKKISKDIGADMKRLAKDINSEKVKLRIKEDMDEAKKFGMQGTPGFIIQGIPVKGAYPTAYFENIINKLKEKKLVQL
jgi:protein-disulfide isomerase